MRQRHVSMWGAVALTVLATAALVRPATAQSAAAEGLFREGKRLMGEGKVNEACNAFDGSYKKQAAVSTLLNLADCREKNGQFATAWGHFIDAARMTRGDAAQVSLFNTARDRSAKLEPRLSHLIINVPDEARVEGLEITRNGIAVDSTEWNLDIPVDGGDYVVAGKAPGYEAWNTKVTVGKEKDKQSVNVPKFNELPKRAEPLVGAGAGAGGGGGGGGEPVDAPSSFTGKRKLAVGVGAAGVVAVVVGTVMYAQGSGTYDDAKAATSNDERAKLTDDANSKYLLAQIGWGVGAAAVGAAAFLWFTGGPAAPTERGVSFAPVVDGGSAGFVVGGRF